MSKAPAFQFYAENFLSGTAEFTCEEVGTYIRLLCHQWHRGGLPSDPKKLRQLAGCTDDALASVVHKFASCTDGLLRNIRLEQARQNQEGFRQSRAQNALAGWEGEKGALRREALAHAHASKVHDSSTCYDHALQSSPSTTTKPPTPLMLRICGWKRVARRAATAWTEKELKALHKIAETPEEDLVALEAYYNAKISKAEDFRRREILTLLNFWPGEIDKAHKFKRNPFDDPSNSPPPPPEVLTPDQAERYKQVKSQGL